MQWFRNLKIRGKLFTAFALVAAVSSLIAGLGAYSLTSVDDSYTEMIANTIEPLKTANGIVNNLNQERILIRDYTIEQTAEGMAEIARKMDRNQAEMVELFKTMDGYHLSPESMGHESNAEEKYRAWLDGFPKIIEAANRNDLLGAQAGLQAIKEVGDEALASVAALVETIDKEGVAVSEANTASANSAVTFMLGALVFGLIAAVALALFLTKAIAVPLKQVEEAAQKLARGDLSINVTVASTDEVGQVAQSTLEAVEAIKLLVTGSHDLTQRTMQGDLSARIDGSKLQGGYRDVVEGINRTLESIVVPLNEVGTVTAEMARGNLTAAVRGDYRGDLAKLKDSINETVVAMNEILTQVRSTAAQVNAGAQQVAEASQAQSQSATEQASSLEETTTAMSQIGEQTKTNAENASRANEMALQFQAASEKGNREMDTLVEAMAAIDRSSQDINRIIKVIDEIAFQTNLLALNAAVEAARAGRHGKGFAVVAEEVRNLAARSAKAAKETADLIEDAIKKAGNGSQMANRTAEGLREISSGSKNVATIMEEIATASNEQALAVSQVNKALLQIDEVTQRNTAGAEEGAAAAEELTSQATQLNGMLARFQLSERQAAGGLMSGDGGSQHVPTFKTRKAPAARASVSPKDVIRLDDDDFGRF